MKTILKIIVLGIFLYGLSPVSVIANSPNLISYQTVIRDNSGNPIVNQTVRLRFTILKSSATGTIVYGEVHTPTTNEFGLVNISIGSGTVATGVFNNINWGSADHFIKIELDADGGTNYTVMGTQQLFSVPYALHAKTVEIDSVDDADANPTNEIQSLSFDNSNGQLSISGGNTITLPTTSGGDNWGTQTVQHNTTLSGNGTSASPLQVIGDLTDDQTLALSGDNLSISGGNTLNIGSIDNQTLSISGNTLSINNGNSVTLPTTSGGDNWGTQTVQHNSTLTGNGTSASPLQVVGDLTDDQTLSFDFFSRELSISNGNIITLPNDLQILNYNATNGQLSISNGITTQSTVTLPKDEQTLSLSGDNLTITSGNSVNLSSVDNQTLSISGSTLSIAGGNNVNIGYGAKAYGTVAANGTINPAKSSNNFTVTKTGTGTYTISSTSIVFGSSTIVVSSSSYARSVIGQTTPSSANILTSTYTPTLVDTEFSFVIY